MDPDRAKEQRKLAVVVKELQETELRLREAKHKAAILKYIDVAEDPFFKRDTNIVTISPQTPTPVDRKVSELLEQRRIEREVNAKLAIIESYGPDRTDDTTLKFTKQFEEGGLKYTYVALRLKGLWHLSGARHAGYPLTWEQFCDFLVAGKIPVTELIELIELVAKK